MTQKLEQLVNTSGFLFQLRVEEEIESSVGKHGWSVASREHPWVDRKKTPVKEHFLDMILRKGNVHMVVECKRSQDASWIFLTEPEDLTGEPGKQHNRAKVFSAIRQTYVWRDFDVRPVTLESEFCVVRGSGEEVSLLERLGRHVVDASEELGRLLSYIANWEGTAAVIPMIVTNAKLYICAAEPAKISLTEGKLTGGSFYDVEYIRFRKSLALGFTEGAAPRSLRAADEDLKRTVFVVNAEHLVPLLQRWNLEEL